MVDEDIGCFATLQKWLIFIVNIILFIFGVVQIGISAYVLAAGTESLGFMADLLDDNDNAVKAVLAFGVILVMISFFACCGAMIESKCMLWIYAIILFFMIMGQAMTIAVVAVTVKYGDSVFEDLWQDLDEDDINSIEQAYQCCSFNGKNVNETWPADALNYVNCSTSNDWDPMQTCWGKFETAIDDNYDMVRISTIIVLTAQILIYFSAHFVIQSIAEAEGAEAEKFDGEYTSGAPKV